MSVRDQAAEEVRANMEIDGDDVVLIAPDDTEYPVSGFVKRVDARVDRSTAIQFEEPMTAVNVALKELVDLGIEPVEGWRVRTTDVTGAELLGVVAGKPLVDRTCGYMTLILEAYTDGD